MRVNLVDSNCPLLVDRGLRLGRSTVMVCNGSFIYDEKDLERVMGSVSKIWAHVSPVNKGFVGLVRFDLIPGFLFDQPKEELEEVDLGPLYVRGVYEINAHSPECAAATSALHRAAPELAEVQPSAARRLAKAIRQTFEGRQILFVPGDGPVKRAWGRIFFENLYRAGLRVEWSEPEQILKNPPSPDYVIWRWGDLRSEGYTEYPPAFVSFIFGWGGTVFNTVSPHPEEDLGSKALLLPTGDPEWDSLVGENFILSPERLQWARENKDNLVLKPLGGSSGIGVVFGRLATQEEWEAKLRGVLGQPYGLFQARWLPKVLITGVPHAVDLNVACWAQGGHLRYLYSLIRIDEWGRYWRRGTINVARGAAFSGPPVDGL